MLRISLLLIACLALAQGVQLAVCVLALGDLLRPLSLALGHL